MGRAALRMEPISNAKSRQITFKRKRDALFKKLDELTTLCEVDASCIIIHDEAASSNPNPTISTWPPASEENPPTKLRRLIDAYRTQNRDPGRVKRYGLSDFFRDRKRKVEEELDQVKRRNREAKYPTWFEPLNSWNGHELTQLDTMLRNNIQSVMSKIETLKQEEKMKKPSQSGAVTANPQNNGTMLMMPQISSSPPNDGVEELGFGAADSCNDNGFFEDSDYGFLMTDDISFEDWIACIDNNK